MPEQMLPSDIRDKFVQRGWQKRSGGDLYFNGYRTTAHPHLHLQTASLRTGTRPREDGDIRLGVAMLAYSVGNRGKTFIKNGGDTVVGSWAALGKSCPMNPETRREYDWIMDYFTSG